MFQQLAGVTFKNLNGLDVPVIMFLGRYDYTTPSSIAAQWMQQLHAPKKVTVWFENSAHLPVIEEPGRVFAALLQYVRPPAPVREADQGRIAGEPPPAASVVF